MSKKSATSDRALSKRVLITIKKDAFQTFSKVVWQHEIPILAELHDVELDDDRGDLQVLDASVLDVGFDEKIPAALQIYNKSRDMKAARPSESLGLGWVFTGDPRAEYQRLADVYGRHQEINITLVEHIYGRFQEGRFTSFVGNATVEDLPESQLRSLIKSYGVDDTDLAQGADLVKLAESIGVQLV